MSQTRSFPCSDARRPELINAVEAWLAGDGFRCQRLQTEDGGTLLQAEKQGVWRKFVGMSTALNIVFRQADDKADVEIGAGRWIDKAAVGTVSLFVLWPLAVTAGIGAWQQAAMPGRVYAYIGSFLGH